MAGSDSLRFITVENSLNTDYNHHQGTYTIVLAKGTTKYDANSTVSVVSPGGTSLKATVTAVSPAPASPSPSLSAACVHLSDNVLSYAGGAGFPLPSRVFVGGKSVAFVSLLQESMYSKLAGKPESVCRSLYPNMHVVVCSGGGFADSSAEVISIMTPRGDFVFAKKNHIDQPLVDLAARPTPPVRCPDDRRIIHPHENFCSKCMCFVCVCVCVCVFVCVCVYCG